MCKKKLLEALISLLDDRDDSERAPKKRRIVYSSSEDEDENSIPKDDNSILDLIGEPIKNENNVEINKKIVELWKSIKTKGFESTMRTDIENKIPNITDLYCSAPKLNSELSASLSNSAKTRDEKMSSKQNHIGLATRNLNKVLVNLIKRSYKENIEMVSNTIRLLRNLYYMESQTRRAIILPGISKNMKEALGKTETPEFLFGSDLHTIIKKSKDLERSLKDLRAPYTKTQRTNLNYWGPSSATQPTQPPGGQRGNYLQKVRALQRRYNRQTIQQEPQNRVATTRQHQWGTYLSTRGKRPAQSSTTKRRDRD